MKTPLRAFVIVIVCSTVSCAHTQEGGIAERLKTIAGGSGMDSATIESGLREALKIGIERTVSSVGRQDGYFGNASIRIPPPSAVQRLDGTLRALGQGATIDAFVLSMNRAAEAAAPLAVDIFAESISQMTIQDARAILHGSDSEATDYFRRHSSAQLIEVFGPVVREKMGEFDVGQRYQEVVRGIDKLPFVRESIESNVEEYTVNKALEGMFFVLAQEEKRIRENPAARTTDLLKKVFGNR